VGGAASRRPTSVTISKQLRYIAPAFRAPGEGPYRLKATKTDEPRTIPLPAFVAEALRERIEQRDAEQRAAKVYAPNDFVFCDERGNSVPLQTLYAWWKGVLKRAGLPDMKWHALRATTVTLLYEADVPEAIIMAIVGHSDLETTRMYKGKTPRAMEIGASRLDEAMG